MNKQAPAVRARGFKIRLERADCLRLYAEANDRNVQPEALLETVVRTVLREHLINAVIDDKQQQPAQAAE